MAETLFPHQKRKKFDPCLFSSSLSLQVSDPQCSTTINCSLWLLIAICFQLPPSDKSERLLPFFFHLFLMPSVYQSVHSASTIDPAKLQRKHQLPPVKTGVAQTLGCFAWHGSTGTDGDSPPMRSAGLSTAGPCWCQLC